MINNIQDLLTNYKSYMKNINCNISAPIKFYTDQARLKSDDLYLLLPKWVDLLIALIVFFIGISDSISKGFKFDDFLISFFAFLVVYIPLLILRDAYSPKVVLEFNKKILEVYGIPLNFDEVVEITFYEEDSKFLKKAFFKKIFMQVKYLKEPSKKTDTVELEITPLSNKRTLILLLKSTFEDKVKYKK